MDEERADALFARYVEQLVVAGLRLSVDDLAGGDAELGAALRERIEAYKSLDAALVREPLSLAGRTLGHYRVLESIGAGGMGEVYRALDTHLGREVALKVLPPLLALDPRRQARFQREARLLALLDHPTVAAIYSVERAAEVSFLVLELVEGETLQARLRRGTLPLEEALPLFRDVASGLEAAHGKGIIHRDLKPANIMITREGRGKILDFGLGKAPGILDPAALSSPAGLRQSTVTGIVLGTPSYMSPEQARGLEVDERTDVWSFGCVVYESLAGRPAFPGESFSEVVAAVVEREPEWTALPAATPLEIRSLLQACLVKDPDRRRIRMAEARLAVERALARPPTRRRWVVPALAATVLAAALGAGLRARHNPASDRAPATPPAPAGAPMLRNGGPPPVTDPQAYREYLKAVFARWQASLGPRAKAPRPFYEAAGEPPEFWVLDGSSGAITARVPLPLTNYRRYFGPAVTPDGTRSYMSLWGPTGRVIVIDNATRTVLPLPGGDGIPVGEAPGRMAFSPDGRRGYVTTLAGVVVVDTDPASSSFHTVLPVSEGGAITAGRRPFGLAVTADGARAYVSNSGSDTVSVIDTDTASPTFHRVLRVPDGQAIRVGSWPYDLALGPTGTRLYVANQRSDTVSVVDTDSSSSTLHTVVATVRLASGSSDIFPTGVAVSRDGSRVYVSCTGLHQLVVIDAVSLAITARIPKRGGKIVLSPDGRRGLLLFVDTVSVIDTDPTSATFHSVLATLGATAPL